LNKGNKLSTLYKQASSLNEDLPTELMKKLSIYGEIYELLGGFHSEATGSWKLAEAKRRETIATVYSLDPEGSNKDREHKAEMAAKDTRREEAKTEAEATRWKNARESVYEQIQIMKKRYDHLKSVANGGV
jgi:hypothetical protein